MRRSSPPDLGKLQKGLYAIFTDPAGARAAAAARPEVAAMLRETPPVDSETRLSVYGDAYYLRLLEALSSDYSGMRRALGEEDFRRLAADYVTTHPPTSRSLADLGELFPGFAERHPLGRRLPFVGELARLERAALTALLTDRLPPLDPAGLAILEASEWERARFVFDPTVRLLDFAWPVAALWRRREEPLDQPGCSLRKPRAQTLVIWRDETWVRVREIGHVEAKLLRGAVSGLKLEELLVHADDAARPSDVQRWFASWVAQSLVKKIALQPG